MTQQNDFGVSSPLGVIVFYCDLIIVVLLTEVTITEDFTVFDDIPVDHCPSPTF